MVTALLASKVKPDCWNNRQSGLFFSCPSLGLEVELTNRQGSELRWENQAGRKSGLALLSFLGALNAHRGVGQRLEARFGNPAPTNLTNPICPFLDSLKRRFNAF